MGGWGGVFYGFLVVPLAPRLYSEHDAMFADDMDAEVGMSDTTDAKWGAKEWGRLKARARPAASLALRQSARANQLTHAQFFANLR